MFERDPKVKTQEQIELKIEEAGEAQLPATLPPPSVPSVKPSQFGIPTSTLLDRLVLRFKAIPFKKLGKILIKLSPQLGLSVVAILIHFFLIDSIKSSYSQLAMWVVAPLTAPVVNPPTSLGIPFSLPTGEVLHYMDPNGNDSCNGTSPALGSSGNCAWLTPNGNAALKCGDVIIAATGNYTNNGIVVTRQPTGCASTTGGIDGAGGIFTVYVLCATAYACVIPSYNGSNPGANNLAIQVQANNWAFEGWSCGAITIEDKDGCYGPSADTQTSIYHHIVFANNIAHDCSFGFGPAVSASPINSNVPGNGADYLAFLGNLAWKCNQLTNDGFGDAIFSAAFVMVNMANSDSSTTAIRSMMRGNFAINNNQGNSGALSDVEGMMRDTPQSHGTVGIDVVRDNVIYGSGANGFQLTMQNVGGANNASPYTLDLSYNTLFGNNACTPWNGFDVGEAILAMNADYAYTVNVYNNLMRTNGALGTCASSAEPNYGLVIGATNGITSQTMNIGGTSIKNYIYGTATLCHNGVCDQTTAPVSIDVGNGLALPTTGFNVYASTADPSFKNTSDLLTNHLTSSTVWSGCSGFETIPACMGWNYGSQTASSLSVIDDLTPQTAGAVGKGYRPPAPCAPDPGSLYPPWLKGFGGYLFWTGSSILYKPGYINAPCGM